MESIFHEKQEGYLCAQHCLNALLQGQYFNAVDLANLADQMDTKERLAMAEIGEDTDDYKRFIEQPSGNMDDSGYFSVQVISSALKVWDLELVPYNSTEEIALKANNDPSQMKAYICNYKGHWFTIRKIGHQWFNLNSMLSGPQLITDTYLAIYLAQLIQDGYSIFIVIGELPACEAEEVLLRNPIVMNSKVNNSESKSNKEQSNFLYKQPKANNEQSNFSSKGYRLGTKAEEEAKILQAAQALENVMVPSTSRVEKRSDVEIIKESLRPRERIIPIKVEGRDEVYTINDDDENAELQKALQLSFENYQTERDKNAKLRLENPPAPSNNFGAANSIEDEEDDELRKALQLSLECVTAPPTPEDIRCHRLAYLGMHGRTPQTESSTKLNT